MPSGLTEALQVALLSQRGRDILRVCQYLASTVQYINHSLLLLVTSALDLPMRTIKFCYGVFFANRSRSAGGVRSAANSSAPSCVIASTALTADGADARLRGVFPNGDFQG